MIYPPFNTYTERAESSPPPWPTSGYRFMEFGHGSFWYADDHDLDRLLRRLIQRVFDCCSDRGPRLQRLHEDLGGLLAEVSKQRMVQGRPEHHISARINGL